MNRNDFAQISTGFHPSGRPQARAQGRSPLLKIPTLLIRRTFATFMMLPVCYMWNMYYLYTPSQFCHCKNIVSASDCRNADSKHALWQKNSEALENLPCLYLHISSGWISSVLQLTLQLFPFSPHGFKEVNKQLINLLSPWVINGSYTALAASIFVYVKSKKLISETYWCLLI